MAVDDMTETSTSIRRVEVFGYTLTYAHGDYVMSRGRIVNELFVTPNQAIMQQGEAGDTLYVVVQGQVSVQVDGREVAVLTEGEHFGELALIDTDPRSATVVAKGFGHLLTIERDALREYCMMEPALGNLVLWKLIATLGQRLRRMNAQLSAASG